MSKTVSHSPSTSVDSSEIRSEIDLQRFTNFSWEAKQGNLEYKEWSVPNVFSKDLFFGLAWNYSQQYFIITATWFH